MANIPLFNLEGRKPYVQFSQDCIKRMNRLWGNSIPRAALLGKNKKGVIVETVTLKTHYSCLWEPSISSNELSKATITLAKKKLSVAGLYIAHDETFDFDDAALQHESYSPSIIMLLYRSGFIVVSSYDETPELLINDLHSYHSNENPDEFLGWVTVK